MARVGEVSKSGCPRWRQLDDHQVLGNENLPLEGLRDFAAPGRIGYAMRGRQMREYQRLDAGLLGNGPTASTLECLSVICAINVSKGTAWSRPISART